MTMSSVFADLHFVRCPRFIATFELTALEELFLLLQAPLASKYKTQISIN